MKTKMMFAYLSNKKTIRFKAKNIVHFDYGTKKLTPTSPMIMSAILPRTMIKSKIFHGSRK